jgi:hypothetical protein
MEFGSEHVLVELEEEEEIFEPSDFTKAVGSFNRVNAGGTAGTCLLDILSFLPLSLSTLPSPFSLLHLPL